MKDRAETSLGPDYFNQLYATEADPWRFETSVYEARKYDATLGALPSKHFARGLEIGCSIGVLTARLASRCQKLLAVDISEQALETARRRCQTKPHVRFMNGQVPRDWPEGSFDLIILSEVLYYFDKADLDRLAARVCRSLVPGGTVQMVHWLGETDYPLAGDIAVEHFVSRIKRRQIHEVQQVREAEYRLDCMTLD